MEGSQLCVSNCYHFLTIYHLACCKVFYEYCSCSWIYLGWVPYPESLTCHFFLFYETVFLLLILIFKFIDTCWIYWFTLLVEVLPRGPNALVFSALLHLDSLSVRKCFWLFLRIQKCLLVASCFLASSSVMWWYLEVVFFGSQYFFICDLTFIWPMRTIYIYTHIHDINFIFV